MPSSSRVVQCENKSDSSGSNSQMEWHKKEGIETSKELKIVLKRVPFKQIDDKQLPTDSKKRRQSALGPEPAVTPPASKRPRRQSPQSVTKVAKTRSSRQSSPQESASVKTVQKDFTPKKSTPAKASPKSSSRNSSFNYEKVSKQNCVTSSRKRSNINYSEVDSPPHGLLKTALANAAKSQNNTPMHTPTSTPVSRKPSSVRSKDKRLSKKELEENLAQEIDTGKTCEPLSSSECESDFESDTADEDFCTPKPRPRRPPNAIYLSTPKSTKKATPASKSSTQKRTPKPSMTPKVPKRGTKLQCHLPDLEEAQARLHVSAVPDSLPCRMDEFKEISGFTEGKILEGSGGCMYISGVPGTGKTATVMAVMRYLKELADEGDLPQFEFIDINGMRLTEPNQAYVQIYKLMSKGKKATADHAQMLLDKHFAGESVPELPKGKKRTTTVLLVDELDMLWNRKQSVLYNLFEWPTRATSHLVVLAIANTMDLPERIMMNRVSSRLGLTRLTFAPYTHEQLQDIVLARLHGLRVFEADALTLVARKVASLSGDARRALDICRRASEIAQIEATKVEIQHVKRAHEEMFCSPKIMAIRCSSKYEQFFLRAVVFCFEKTGLEEAAFNRVLDTVLEQLALESLPQLNMAEGFEIVFSLAASGLLLVEHGKLGPSLRIRLNVSTDDVMFALNKDAEKLS